MAYEAKETAALLADEAGSGFAQATSLINDIEKRITSLKTRIHQNAKDHVVLDNSETLLIRIKAQISQLEENPKLNKPPELLTKNLRIINSYLQSLLPEEKFARPPRNFQDVTESRDGSLRSDIRKQLIPNFENYELIGRSAACICGILVMAAIMALIIISRLTGALRVGGALLGGFYASILFGCAVWAIAAKFIYDPQIEALVESITALEKALTHQSLPALVANKIYHSLQLDVSSCALLDEFKPSWLPNENARIFAVVESIMDEEATTVDAEVVNQPLFRVCEYLIENGHRFMIIKNEGKLGGYIIEANDFSRKLRRKLFDMGIRVITCKLDRDIPYDDLNHYGPITYLNGSDRPVRLKASGIFQPEEISFPANRTSFGARRGADTIIIGATGFPTTAIDDGMGHRHRTVGSQDILTNDGSAASLKLASGL